MGVRANRPTFGCEIYLAPAFRAITKEVDQFAPVEFHVGFEAAGIHVTETYMAETFAEFSIKFDPSHSFV